MPSDRSEIHGSTAKLVREEMLLRHIALAFAVLMLGSATVGAAEPWDAAVRRLCTSLEQQDCWIKAAAALCDREQMACRNLDDHTPAIVLGKAGKRWNVKTASGSGWVSDRLMMIDGSKMQ